MITKNFTDIEKKDFLSKIFRYSKKIAENKFCSKIIFLFLDDKNSTEIDFCISKKKVYVENDFLISS